MSLLGHLRMTPWDGRRVQPCSSAIPTTDYVVTECSGTEHVTTESIGESLQVQGHSLG